MEPVSVCSYSFAVMRLGYSMEGNVDRGCATASALGFFHRFCAIEVLFTKREGGCGHGHAAGDDQQGHGGQESHGLGSG